MTSTDQHLKHQAETGYRSTRCDVRGCSAIASHKTKIEDVPHGTVTFHTCADHYDRWNGRTWSEFHPHVKAYNEFHG